MTAPTPARPRTAAASDVHRRRGAKRAVIELITRLPHLEDRTVARLTERLLVECAARGIDARGLIPAELLGEVSGVDATWEDGRHGH